MAIGLYRGTLLAPRIFYEWLPTAPYPWLFNERVYFPYLVRPASLYDWDDIIGTPAIDNTRTIDVQAENLTQNVPVP